MKRLIIISAVFIFINSCSEESTLFDPTYFGDGFKGITFTAEDSPDPLKEDPTDWWPGGYVILGKTNHTKGTPTDIPVPLNINFGAAYPNPVALNKSTNIPFSIPQQMNVYIYVINKDYRIIAVLVNNILQAGMHQVSLDTELIGVAGVYRVVFESEGIYCKGDVWIKGSGN